MERLIPKSFFPLISSLSLSLPANGDCAARVGGGKDGSGTAMAAAVDRIRGGGEQRRGGGGEGAADRRRGGGGRLLGHRGCG